MKRSNNDTQRPTHYTCMASRTPRPSLLGFCVNACQDMSRRPGSSGEPSHHLCTGHTEPVLALVPPSLDARRQLRQGRFEVDDVQGADAASQAAKLRSPFFIATARCLLLHAIGHAKRPARASRSPRRE
ncbi:hypothetical protein TESG_02659 [Trichophyton tonsurans CBS 112818]|uniref:Uncharacterized protein n=2 Tax=Trichophyton TaxID=5550 RepID=F2PPN7_TRIEC|nr:hypothetical protein TESG_02659 [Trichophyton tonsurans CBS 112818]EGE03855.1 hypothetical protein TEQG_02889 [Trichophyton equinum CBS 127.97]